MSKLIVTGAAGFIAPHIIEEALRLDWTIIAIDRIDVDNKISHPKITYLKIDVNNLKDEHLHGVDFIAHMAFITNIPYCINNPVETTDENINTSVKFLALATKNKIKKFIYPSTASLYGHNPIPWRENMNVEPIEPYSWHKHSVEKLCKMWNTRYGLKTSVLRLYQVYGENQRKDTALAAFIKAKKTGQTITLTETTAQSSFRTGRRDFIYVKDVARAFISAMLSEKTGNGEVINIGTGIMTTMEDIAKTIGGKVEFIPKRNFEVEAHQADMVLCSKLLDWKPTTKVLDWLAKFLKNT